MKTALFRKPTAVFTLLICISVMDCFAASAVEQASYLRSDAVHFVLDDYCVDDCSGYSLNHSPRFRRTFARALCGNFRALRQVFRDPRFHSGDNEAWEAVPGNLLFAIGDQRFARFLSHLSVEEQRSALIYIPIAAPFHDADLRGEQDYFKNNFPNTYKIHSAFLPTMIGS